MAYLCKAIASVSLFVQIVLHDSGANILYHIYKTNITKGKETDE